MQRESQNFRTAEVIAAVDVRGLEATVRRRDAVLAAIAFAASRFLGTADWERDIHEVLGRLGAAVECSRVYLFDGHHDEQGAILVETNSQWVAHKPLSFAQRPLLDLHDLGLGRWRSLERGEIIHGPLDSMPPAEREYFASIGVQSIAAMPLFAGDEWWGYLGFADDLTPREWSRSVLEALQAAAASIGAAIYRKRAEDGLRESEARFRILTEAAFEGVFIHEQGVMIEGNAALARIFGYELHEMIGRNMMDFIATAESRALIAKNLATRSTDRYEVQALHSNGTVMTALITGRDTTYKGRTARVTTVQDITEVKRAELELRRQATQEITARHEADLAARALMDEQIARVAAEVSGQRAAFLAEASRLLGASLDYQTTMTTLMRLAVPAIADYGTFDVLGRDGHVERVAVAHVVPEKEALLWELRRWLHIAGPIMQQLRGPLFDGKSLFMSEVSDELLASLAVNEEHGSLLRQILPRSSMTVPLTVGGRLTGALALYSSESGRRFDADDLALAEELARRASLAVQNARLFQEAESATRARDQMLGIVAHDLRNPLGTIGMAANLLEDVLEEGSPARQHLAIVGRAVGRMNRLIGDLLDVKRLENGPLSIETRPVLATTLLSDAVEMMRALAGASSLELVLDVPAGLPTVSVDTNRIQQVMSNLMGNAIKFTPRGGSITVAGMPDDEGVRVTVSDTGPGIPPDQLPHIFNQFWQGSKTDRRGIGLGLAIAKGIVEAHGGRIWVASTLGDGTSFHFTLPATVS